MAKILANDLIQVYIENQLLNLNKHIGIANSDIGKMRLQWTGSKTALIELIYAL
ncbi:RteC domain-containing protein [Sphingobacterium hotanense]|uniref:RteC domain-containing protein n=1 Tax=Sphingobacterium hotanense TaxID=649196 RepID=UPI003D9C4A1B